MPDAKTNDHPIAEFSGTVLDTLASDQRRRLCAMFDDPELERLRHRHPGHPAVSQYDHLKELEENGVTWPDEFQRVSALAAIGLDYSAWAPDPPFQGFWDFLDAETRAWTIPMLEDPDHYGDVMAELFVWGWLGQQSLAAVRVNKDGQSDILIKPDDWPCEVKRIRRGTRVERIREVLAKANQQIKASPVEGGSVFIHIERDAIRAALDDRIPNDVAPFIALARRVLHPGQLRSVAQVIVTWDDMMIFGEAPAPVLYAFRRRSLVLEHPAPRVPARYSAKQLEIGRSMVTTVKYEGAGRGGRSPDLDGIQAAGMSVSQLFRQENEFSEGVRANHAIEAFAEPDDLRRLSLGDAEIHLATRAVAQGANRYVLLVVAVRLGDEQPQIVGGYRLYRSEHELDISQDAFAAFRTLLDRYGMEVSAAGYSARFIPFYVAPPGEGIGISDSESHIVSALVRRRSDGATEFAAVYALDTSRYRAALRRKES